MNSALAPIALFTFRRAAHTENVLRSLQSNPELSDSPLYIYCDGPRSADQAADVAGAREVIRARAPKHAVVLERESNLGLDRSIIAGVSELCAKYGRVIVVEDDLEVAPTFLAYMNQALRKYENHPKVMQVSGYMFPVEFPFAHRAFFLPLTTSWGWATWARAWKAYDQTAPLYPLLRGSRKKRRAFDLHGSYPYFNMLESNLKREQPAWDIIFYSNVFSAEGLVLQPSESLVRNNGFDGSGENCGVYSVKDRPLGSWMASDLPSNVVIDVQAQRLVEQHLRQEGTLFRKVKRRLEGYLVQYAAARRRGE